ncbi:hypothetical protein [Streptomyces albidoflavus]|uniref:hypothetical protein n=1 Tax=Streptomyces albidoflavus TaxID=1886 RepID=UPI0033C1C387
MQPDIPQRRHHETLGVQRLAVRSEDYWEYRPEQRVQTSDGLPGVVQAVLDGPFPGSEEYHVVLDRGMGGGRYTASQLRPAAATTAAMEQTAAADYPELAQILVERPDPAGLATYAAKADNGDDDSEDEDEAGADDSDNGEGDDDGEGDAPPWAKEASLLFESMIVTAATDADFRFQVTAAWRDVVAKAKRIRSEGGVRVTLASDGLVFAEVRGDHEVYETGLQRLPNRTAVHTWSCGCKWGAYHWGADDDFSRFAGRMCSHALALQYEAQSRGMFGREVNADEERPAWVPRKVVVRYDIDADTNRLVPATARRLSSWDAPEPSMWDMDGDHNHEAERQAKSEEWDSIHEGLGDIHRGVNVHLRPEDHAIVHDPSRPMHERAQHLMKSLPHSDLARGREGLGRHWSDNEGVAESFGEMDARPNRHGTHPTSVVFHAEKPDRHAIDEAPDQSDGEIYGYHDHGEREIPLHPGAGVNLKGVSWKNMGTPDEDFRTFKGDGLFDHLWEHQRHDFAPHGHSAHASLAPLSVVARAAVQSGEAQEEVEFALALSAAGVRLASVDAPFGEPSGTSHQMPKAPGATSPKAPWENPASAGPLAGADPGGWNCKLPLESFEAALFEPGGAEAELHDEPEGALPATDGVQIPSDDEALTPSMAGLRRQALKDFSLAEREALINEGENVRAANLDRLVIDGTHYADLEQILAAQEDDISWLT